MKDTDKIVDLTIKQEPVFVVTNQDLLKLAKTVSDIQNDMSKLNEWITKRITNAGLQVPQVQERCWRED